MFSPSTLEDHVRPRGMKMRVTETTPKDSGSVLGIESYARDRKHYKAVVEGLTLSKTFVQCDIEFSIPVPDTWGVFDVDGRRRYVVQEGIVDVGRFQLGRPPDFIFRTRTRVFLMALNEIFNRVFLEFFMRAQPPTSLEIQTAIDAWISSSELTQDVPEGDIGVQSLRDLVYLRVGEDGLDNDLRKFSNRLWGRIDPSSTPQGDKVNLAYRMARDAELLGPNLRPGPSLFCSTTQTYGIAGKYSPRRLHLVRSGIEHALPLVKYERPLVGAPGVPGRHLRTGLLHLRSHNGEDAIVISASAAEKLTAIRNYREQVWSTGRISLKVAEGDPVSPGQILAECLDPLDEDNDEVNLARAAKTKYPCFVERIRGVRTVTSGIASVRADVYLRAEIPVETGDKLYTRAAVKGVARVVPDEEMPLLPDGRPLEALISPESVVGRRAMLVFWEMMANEFVRKTKQPVVADHLSPSPTFEELVAMGYGEGVRLRDPKSGEEYSQETFCGLTFFLRHEKLAREMLSAHDDKLSLNGMGLPVDSARVSGQKRDLAKALAMLARGLNRNFQHSLVMNMCGQHAYRELSKVLQCS